MRCACLFLEVTHSDRFRRRDTTDSDVAIQRQTSQIVFDIAIFLLISKISIYYFFFFSRYYRSFFSPDISDFCFFEISQISIIYRNFGKKYKPKLKSFFFAFYILFFYESWYICFTMLFSYISINLMFFITACMFKLLFQILRKIYKSRF